MKRMFDELQLISGIDIPHEELQITLHQPKIKEIAAFGEQNYFLALQIFSLTKEKIKSRDPNLTNWMVFREAIQQKVEGIDNLLLLMKGFLQLFCVGKFNIGPNSLIVMSGDQVISIEPEQFDVFQYGVLAISGSYLLTSNEQEFNTKSKKANEIAEKMKKARKKLAAIQGTDIKPGQSVLSRYLKSLPLVTSNTFDQINNFTIYQSDHLLKAALAKEAYDLDVASRFAGANSEEKLIHWTVRMDQKEESSIGTI